MKPGMQRDLLAAYWLLFDDFAMDDESTPSPPNPSPPASMDDPAKKNADNRKGGGNP
ncbi:MAG: hypothetical protein HY270_10100 [Deltaproteobacteria bacterium]|nr:hypothetical protein [Deltaproteobacteria bacterium]